MSELSSPVKGLRGLSASDNDLLFSFFEPCSPSRNGVARVKCVKCPPEGHAWKCPINVTKQAAHVALCAGVKSESAEDGERGAALRELRLRLLRQLPPSVKKPKHVAELSAITGEEPAPTQVSGEGARNMSGTKRKKKEEALGNGEGVVSAEGQPLAVLITGGSQGIGLSIALKFLSEGGRVVIVSRNANKAKARVPSKYMKEKEQRAFFVSKDLTTGCQECVDEAATVLGNRLDVVVNNAGAGVIGKSIGNTSAEDWDTAFNINLRSYMLVTQAALPFLEASKGAVVNMSGVAAHRPFTTMLPYCCAKAGVEMLTKCTALEVAKKGVRVNSVAPGTIDTDFLARAGLGQQKAHDFLAESVNCQPLGRIGQPTDVSEAVFFLASSKSSGFITGQSIMLDGGRTLALPSGSALKSS